jgi:hypothetical protein
LRLPDQLSTNCRQPKPIRHEATTTPIDTAAILKQQKNQSPA